MDKNFLIGLKKKIKNKLIIAVTGVPGCGKSLFCSMLASMGFNYISSDACAAKLLTKKKCYSKILKEFGKSVSDGNLLNKRKLADAVFGDKGKRKRLEAYLHPLITSEIYSEIKKSEKNIAVIEAPLLFESGFDVFADLTICVKAKREEILKRLYARGWSRREAKIRMSAQLSQEEKAFKSDMEISNNGNKKELLKKALQIKKFAESLIS
ncbi:MAG: dephospho-CoA kinase [Elusimicrobia bacterium]|nr:dephospho-CoA kinase [Elusimicrobiota bacterium]